jgi:chromosome transmission fidelity protein 1
VSLQSLDEGLKDEPQWIVDQMLKRRREELARQWEDREKKLEQIRAKEKLEEARSAKRRRLDEGRRKPSAKADDSDDDEWLLDEPEDSSAAADGDALSGLSKKTRDILERFGLGNMKHDAEDEAAVKDGVKVRRLAGQVQVCRRHDGNASRYSTHQERIPSFRNSCPSCAGPRSPRPSHRRW